MRLFARSALFTAGLMVAAGPALAQNIPPGQSCGGLLCDMGMFGHKVPVGPNGEALPPEKTAAVVAEAEANDPHRLPCHDFLCRAFGQKEADAAPPSPPPSTAVAPEAVSQAKATKKKRKHVAKAEAATTAAPK